MRAIIPLHWLLFIVPFDVYHSGKSNKFHHRRSDVKKEEAFAADAFFRFILFSFIRPALEKYEIRNLWHLALLFDLLLSILKVCRRKVAAHTIFILLHLIRKEDYSKILIFTHSQPCLHWNVFEQFCHSSNYESI